MNRNAKYLSQTMVAGLVGLAACGQEPPTAPDLVEPLPISTEERVALRLVVEDAVAWLVPALDDRVAAKAMREALEGVAAQLGAGSQRAFDQSIERARAVLARYDGGGALESGSGSINQSALQPDAPLLAMIRLTLGQVTTLAHQRPVKRQP